MNGLAFFDTNVLVYAGDASSPKKRERAVALFGGHLRHGTAVLSLQVLQEYLAAATRKLGLAPEIAQRKAARSAGAAVLFSEDFQPGAVLGVVRVVNPFLG